MLLQSVRFRTTQCTLKACVPGLPSAGFLAVAQFPGYQGGLPGPAAHNGGA